MSIVSKTNKYGDILLTVPHDKGNLVEYFETLEVPYDSTKGYIVHLEVRDETLPTFPDDFRYITAREENGRKFVVYGNDHVIASSPKVIDEEVNGAVVVLTVSLDTSPGELYVVFVKDRTKRYWTNPSGTKEPGETYVQCAIRECKEETGVSPNTTFKQIGDLQFKYSVFEVIWNGGAMIYSTHAVLSAAQFEALKQFNCDEIGKVQVIPVSPSEPINIDNITSIDGDPVSAHHLLAAQFAVHRGSKDIDWESKYPDYLEGFRLYSPTK